MSQIDPVRPLDGRVAVVTGAATGLGREIAVHMAQEGAVVVAVGLESGKAEGLRTVELVEEAGGVGQWISVDIRDSEAVAEMIGEVVARHGVLDILVNNAGSFPTIEPSAEQPLDVWRLVIDTNLNGTWYVSRAAITAMLKTGRHGTIINISSRLALSGGGTGRASYCASKAAVSNLTRQMAVEYGPQGIRVNAICPGFIAGTAAPLAANSERIALASEQTPLWRLGRASDIARAAVFLASDDAEFINGHNLVVDGGASVRP